MSEENKDLPIGWALAEIQDIALVNPPGSEMTVEDNEQVTFVPMAAVEALTGKMDVALLRSFAEVKKGFTRFREGDLLFAKITPCMENGKIAIARQLHGGVGCGSTEFHVIRAEDGISEDFVRLWMSQSSYRQEAERNMQGAVGQRRVPTGYIRKSKIPIGPSLEQKRIVSKIDELFSEIVEGERALEKVRTLVVRYRQSVLKAAVTGELTRDWREQHKDKLESGEALLARILKARREAWEAAELAKMNAKEQTPKNDLWKAGYGAPETPITDGLPDLPSNWTWSSLPMLGEFGRGKSKHRPRNDKRLYGGPYPFFQTGTVRASNGKITHYDTTYSEFGLAQSKLWPRGTICITIAANIAESGILDFEACFPDSIVGLVSSRLVVPEYVEFFIRTARSSLSRYAPATAQKNINLDILERVAVPLPPLEEQKLIYSIAQSELSKIDHIESELASNEMRSTALRQSLLKSAFTGKLVPQDTYDEPASTLLERIAAERADTAKRTKKKPTMKTRRTKKAKA